MAAGMAREQSAGVLCAVLVEEGRATEKELGSLELLVMSIIHGLNVGLIRFDGQVASVDYAA